MLKFLKKDKLSMAVKILAVGIAILVILWLNYKEILDSEVVASIITSIVTMLVVFITTRSTIIQSKINSETIIEQSKSQRNIDAITKNRVEWMQKLKEYMSEYITIVLEFAFSHDEEIYNSEVERINILANKTRLHLNFIGIADQYVLEKIKSINKSIEYINGSDQSYKTFSYLQNKCLREIELLTLYVQIYLKTEWERVKFESENGNTYKFDFDREFNKYKEEKLQEINILEDEIKTWENKYKNN